jgi:hypothetical protein
MRVQVFGSLVTALALVAAPAAAEVRVSINDGHVSVSAKDATVAQILAEWARVGQTRIVNAERVPGSPLTLELTNVPEAQALDTLLRSVSGYLAAPRANPVANASQYDRIFLLPTSTASPARAAAVPSPLAPAFQPPPVMAVPPEERPDEEVLRANGMPQGQPNPPPRGPIFNGFPAPPVPQRPVQQADPAATRGPAMPVGVATPGMPVPVPQQPQQNQNPGGDRP